ncbi:MAG: TonB-dependent receptor [Phenylobacterium sp.]|uniref:TonB-dependent receptor n=1 Tax=Phenylobacterium sp. TaxID=1871053 RepID=UPI001A5634E5|nr:TonB-dependent receptor [Phenylobacterium sp.]MBL8553863.1 TonB-dependent receptor [Phenylobacterium sp.]
MTIRHLLATPASLLLLSSALPALAAETADAGDETAAGAIEEVVVTARRREEALQKVPVAVSVVSAAALARQNIQSVVELERAVPGLSSQGQTRDNVSVSIRGQGTGQQASLPGVLIYLNEVPIPYDQLGQSVAGPGLYMDLQNVQVLKGPQGTLFGRNSVGGAILLQTQRPGPEFGGRIQVGVGNYANRELDAALNVPLAGEKLVLRLAARAQDRKGFTRLLAEPSHPGGLRMDDVNYWSLRGTLSWRASDSVTNTLTLEHLDSENNGTSYVLHRLNPAGNAAVRYPGLAAQFAQQQALGIRTRIASSLDNSSTRKYTFLTNVTEFEVSENISVKNIFGYMSAHRQYSLEADGSPFPVSEFAQPPGETFRFNQYSEELQIHGVAFDGRLDWIVGGLYLKNPTPGFYNRPAITFGATVINASRFGSESKGLYTQGTYDLGDLVEGLKFTGGFRYTWDRRFAQSRGLNAAGVCVNPPASADARCTLTGDTRTEAPTWTVGLDWQATPQVMVYGVSRRGYRAGGYNALNPNIVTDNRFFDPEYVTDYEVGLKADWRVGSVPIRTNIALYHQDYSDIQVTEVRFVNGQQFNSTSNAGAARINGGELEATANLTPDLQVGGFLSYIDFAYTKFAPGANAASLRAQETANRPVHQYGLNARHRLPLPPSAGEGSVFANWSWRDDAGNTSLRDGVIPSYGLLSAGAEWNDVAGSGWDAAIFATNILNKDYVVALSAAFETNGYTSYSYGEPRMFGVRLRYRFGGER